jgi:general secretion pathway protein H
MMSILALGINNKISGFTLLELLVVMVVTGISLSLVMPSLMKNDDDVLNEESTRLIALIEYAADTATSRGVWLAWSPTADGYRFLQLDDDKNIWQPIIADEVLRERHLPDGYKLMASTQQKTNLLPNALLRLSPSGIHTPFQISLIFGENKRIIQGNLLGNVNLLSLDQSLALSP